MTNLHCGDAVVDSVSLNGFKSCTLDHVNDLLFGHFYFAAGFDEVDVGVSSSTSVMAPSRPLDPKRRAVWAVAECRMGNTMNPDYAITGRLN